MNGRFREGLAGFIGFAVIFVVAAFIVSAPYSRIIPKILLFSIFALWVVYAVVKYGKNSLSRLFPEGPVAKSLLLAILVVCFLTLSFSLDPFHSQKILVNRFFPYALAFLAGFGIARESRVSRKVIVISLIAATIVLASGSIFDYIRFHHPPRLFTSFGVTIPFLMLPLFLSLQFPCVFAIATVVRHWFYRTFAVIATLLIVPVILWQGSRTAWAASVAALLFISFFRSKKLFTVVLIVLAGVGMFGFSCNELRGKLVTFPQPEKWSCRTPLFDSALAVFRDHPILGAGPGMFEKMIHEPKYALPQNYESTRNMLHAHNMYFEVLAEMGIAGLLVFLAIFAAFFHAFIKRPRREDEFSEGLTLAGAGMVFGILFFMISGSVVLVGLNDSLLFWFILGAAL